MEPERPKVLVIKATCIESYFNQWKFYICPNCIQLICIDRPEEMRLGVLPHWVEGRGFICNPIDSNLAEKVRCENV